jgi:hypothetical protein
MQTQHAAAGEMDLLQARMGEMLAARMPAPRFP